MQSILVTGGAGFIGSNFVRYILNKYAGYKIINLDKLTYAGNRNNLADVMDNPNHEFVKGDICNAALVTQLAERVDAIINFAAETHVDRAIMSPGVFIKTDMAGTHTLLQASRKFKHKKFVQISTDEVYGSTAQGKFTEESKVAPSNPYSASKAAGDLLVLSYFKTYGMPVCVTRSSNNFGPYQHPEKFVPLFITNALQDKELPLYGDGKNVRDWLYVEDNCAAIDAVFHSGINGEIYNIAGGNEVSNKELAGKIVSTLGKPMKLIRYVKDRPGHDKRYAVETKKITEQLGWRPEHTFLSALIYTIKWYQENSVWWEKKRNRNFLEFYSKQYGDK
ncbi:MAG: dTDP-glucose 4,6-dehydratase [Elusimicrobiota bacterium]